MTLIVTFFGAVENLNPNSLAGQFKILACDEDYKMGPGVCLTDKKNGGLGVLFANFTGNSDEAEVLVKKVVSACDEMKSGEIKSSGKPCSFRYMGEFTWEEGASLIISDPKGYAVVVTPMPNCPSPK